MKWSIYNELISTSSRKDKFYLFNCLKEKYFILDPNLKGLLLSGKDDVSVIEAAHPDLYEFMVSEKFIIPEETDEVSECVERINRKFSMDELLQITVNPTLDCNLNCWYCYESHIKGSCMQRDTIESIGKLIDRRVCSKTLKMINLSFFGGEPLLKYKEVVQPIAKLCNESAHKGGKSFGITITSNGVLLTSEVSSELKSLADMVGVQVAFDGGRDMHDRVKQFPNHRGSYDIVLKNLKQAIDNDLSVNIRCNFTLSNIDSFKNLIEDFKEYVDYPNVRFSFHKVWQEPDSDELFARKDKLRKYLNDMGLKSNMDTFYGDSLFPCYADYDNNIVINYNGDIFRCTARDFKHENRIGYLSKSGEIIYKDKHPVVKLTEQCYKCRLLPICTICFQQRGESRDGICPYPRSFEHADANIVKYFLDITKFNENVKEN